MLWSVQRTLDLTNEGGGHVPKDVAHRLETITQRLDVLEEAVAADQEQSLHTLEAIMKSTQQHRDSRFVDTSVVEDSRPVFPVSPHVTGTPSIRPLTSQSRSPLTNSSRPANTGILSVKVSK